MDKFSYAVEEGRLKLGLDTNEDGEKALELDLSLNEAIQEAFQKGEAVEGVKSAKVEFTGTTLLVRIDSDKDGEELAVLKLNLAEAIDETGILK